MSYFVWKIGYSGKLPHLRRLIEAQAEVYGVTVRVAMRRDNVVLSAPAHQERLSAYIASLASLLPASLFLREATHTFETDDPLAGVIRREPELPLCVAPCPSCQKEMFDIASRRYYYPFTSCNACGAQTPFVEAYPYTREHTAMRFFVPCKACQEELKANPFRKNYPLISCSECGIALRMNDAKSERFANTKGEYKRLFEIAARAIAEGKRVLVKTLFGYRLFFVPESPQELSSKSTLMVCDANALNALLTLIPQEFNALLSIERPTIRVTVRDEKLKGLFGASAWCTYADDGVSMLLARELLEAGHQWVAFEAAEETSAADYTVSFDVPVRFAEETRYFVNQDTGFTVRGTRLSYPRFDELSSRRLIVANGLVSLPWQEGVVSDDAERFDAVDAAAVYIAEGETFRSGHSLEVRFAVSEAAMLSVLAEHDAIRTPAAGVWFDDTIEVMYYNGVEVRRVLTVTDDSRHVCEAIASLREGSDRLVARYTERFGARVEKLEAAEGMLEKAAAILGLEGADALSAAALEFYGKGGTQVDTRIRDNRFDTAAFYASLMSYVLADADVTLLCYSIYESLGDFFGTVASQVARDTGSKHIVLCGEGFANQAIFGRLTRQLGTFTPLFAKSLPVGAQGALLGAHYLP